MARSTLVDAGHRGEVAHPAQQAAGDARRAAGAAGDLGGAVRGQRHAELLRRRGGRSVRSSSGV